MDDSFNPLDLLECDVVEGEGEVQIPEVNKGGIENGDETGEVESLSQAYLETPQPIFDLLDYNVCQQSVVVDDDGSKNPTQVQEFLRPRLLSLLNQGHHAAYKVYTPATATSSSVVHTIHKLPPLTAAPTPQTVWAHPTIPTMPKLVPIPKPILSTSVSQHTTPVNMWIPSTSTVQPSTSTVQPSASTVQPSTSSIVQPISSTDVASSSPPLDLEKDPLAIRPQHSVLLCSHAETSFRSELQRYISKYSITFFRLHCSACGVHIKSTLYTVDGAFKMHRFLRVLICQKCSEYYGNGYFPIEDGSEIYCFWCGRGKRNGGRLYACSNCPKSFCEQCVIRNFGAKTNIQIAEKQNWACFVCDFYLQGKNLWIHRAMPALLQKHIKQLRSEAALLEGNDKENALKQDFSLCCISNNVTRTIEVALPYWMCSITPLHLVTNLYKLVCKPGTEPKQKKPQLYVAEETLPGRVSVGQERNSEKQEINVPTVNLDDDSFMAPPTAENIKWLTKVTTDSEQLVNDFKMKLSYCNLYSKNINNLSFNCIISNLETLFKESLKTMRKIYNCIEREKKKIVQNNVRAIVANTKGAVTNGNAVNMTDRSQAKVDQLLLSRPQVVLEMENKENQFNESNVNLPTKSVNVSKVKISRLDKKKSAPKSFSRKRKLEICDRDEKNLFKKYKLKNCSVVLKRIDLTHMYNLKKCNVVLRKTDLIYK